MSWGDWALDGAIALLLTGLAIRLLTTREVFEAIVLFVSLGLSLSLAWVRVGAPDLALAEAALGAGVTGALFLNAYRQLTRRVGEPGDDGPELGDDGPEPGKDEPDAGVNKPDAGVKAR